MTSPHRLPPTAVLVSILLCFSVLMLSIECSPLLLSSFLPALEAAGAGVGGEDVTNGSSVLAALALEHLQHKADALAQLAEVLALGANVTEALFLN